MIAQGAEVTGLSWMRGTEEPIRGSATANAIRWEESALANPDRLVTDMAILGFPAHEIQSAFELATDAKAEVDKAVSEIERRREKSHLAAGIAAPARQAVLLVAGDALSQSILRRSVR